MVNPFLANMASASLLKNELHHTGIVENLQKNYFLEQLCKAFSWITNDRIDLKTDRRS